jgi:hypothetical protein
MYVRMNAFEVQNRTVTPFYFWRPVSSRKTRSTRFRFLGVIYGTKRTGRKHDFDLTILVCPSTGLLSLSLAPVRTRRI